MKKILCLFAMQACMTTAYAQIINNDFEEWHTASTGLDSAGSWSSTNRAVHHVTTTVTTHSKTNSKVSGNFGARLSTSPFGFVQTPIIGIMVNGKAKLDFDAVNTSYISGGGTPISTNPISLKGHYFIDGPYPALMEILLSKYNSTAKQRDTVGFTSYTMASTSSLNYVPFMVALNYATPAVTADSITIIIYSSLPSAVPAINASYSILHLDSLGLVNPEIDGEIFKITSPAKGTVVSTEQSVEAWVRNAGTLDISNFDLSYSVNGGSKVTETFSGLITPGDSSLYTFTQKWTPTLAGDVDVCVYLESIAADIDLLNDTACVELTSNLALGENFEENEIAIFPNPAGSYFIIETPETARMELYDLKGKLLHTAEVRNRLKVNTSASAKGVYLCRIYDIKGTPVAQQKINLLR